MQFGVIFTLFLYLCEWGVLLLCRSAVSMSYSLGWLGGTPIVVFQSIITVLWVGKLFHVMRFFFVPEITGSTDWSQSEKKSFKHFKSCEFKALCYTNVLDIPQHLSIVYLFGALGDCATGADIFVLQKEISTSESSGKTEKKKNCPVVGVVEYIDCISAEG